MANNIYNPIGNYGGVNNYDERKNSNNVGGFHYNIGGGGAGSAAYDHSRGGAIYDNGVAAGINK